MDSRTKGTDKKGPVSATGIGRNWAFMLAARIMPRLLSGAFFALIARVLSVEQLGTYVLASYFAGLANPVVNLGLTQVSMRDIATHQGTLEKHFLDLVVLRACSTIAGLALVQLGVYLLDYPPSTSSFLRLATVAIVPVGVGRLLQDFLVALEINEYNLVIELVVNALNLIAGIGLLLTGYGLRSLALLSIGVGLVRLGLSLALVLRKIGCPELGIDFPFLKSKIETALSFFAIEVFQSTENRLDGILLSKMQGEATVGLYGSAVTLVQMAEFIPATFYQAILPSMARSYADNLKQQFRNLYRQSFRVLFVLSVEIAVIVSLLADRFVLLIFGPSYQGSVGIVRVLIWSLVVYSASMVLGTASIASHSERPYARFAGMAMITNIALNFALIPELGATGAAVAKLCSMSILVAVVYRFISNRVVRVSVLKLLLRPAMASLLTIPVVLVLSRLNLVLVVASAGICYVVLLVALGALTGEELEHLRRIVPERFPLHLINDGYRDS